MISYYLKNFCVIQKGEHYFAVMEGDRYDREPIGEEITSGTSFHNAFKKAKLLQRGYDIAKDYTW